MNIKEIRQAFVSGYDDDHLHIDIAVSSKKFKAGDNVIVTIEKKNEILENIQDDEKKHKPKIDKEGICDYDCIGCEYWNNSNSLHESGSESAC